MKEALDFIYQINAARAKHSWSATEVATALGANIKTVSAWLNKTRQPKLDDLRALARVVGLKSLKID